MKLILMVLGSMMWNQGAGMSSPQSSCPGIACLARSGNSCYCLACNGELGYVSDNNGGCTKIDIPFCLFVGSAGNCLVCGSGLVPVAGGCGSGLEVTNCIKFKAKSLCELCSPGYYVASTGKCVAVEQANQIANCEIYFTQGICMTCRRGFYMSMNACYPVVSYCMAPSGHTCLQCEPGFILSTTPAALLPNYNDKEKSFDQTGIFQVGSFACTQVVFNCAKFATQTTCAECAPNHYLNNGSCYRATYAIDKCKSYGGASYCIECNEGYFPDQNGSLCTVANGDVANCLFYSARAVCGRCIPGFYNTLSGSCLPVDGVNIISGCAAYNGAQQCLYCIWPMMLVNNACLSATATVSSSGQSNCLRPSSVGCLMCAANFYPLNGNCVAVSNVVDNCARYASSGACLLCQEGFFLSGGLCQGAGQIPNCELQSGLNECRYCQKGFALQGGKCIYIVEGGVRGCLYLASPNTCALCETGFRPNGVPATACIQSVLDNCDVFSSRTVCKYCLNGYYFDTSVNRCVVSQLIPNCNRYTGPKTCVRCLAPFYLSNNQCIQNTYPIAECINYEYVNGSVNCVSCKTLTYVFKINNQIVCNRSSVNVFNCAVYDNDGICRECGANYYLLNNKCEKAAMAISNCLAYDFEGTCIRCSSTRYLTQGVCITIPTESLIPDCVWYSGPSTCGFCSTGHYLKDNKCVDLPTALPNCLFYVGDGCGQCKSGFFVSGKVCVESSAIILGCEVYSDNGICAECQTGLALVNSACVSTTLAENCMFLGLGGKNCLLCKSGYYSLNGVCTPVTKNIMSCQFYSSSNYCAFCTIDSFIEKGVCYTRPLGNSNCVTYSSQSTCTSCTAGYYLKENYCYKSIVDIPNCLGYVTASTCKNCKKGYIPSSSGTVCLANCEIIGPYDTCSLCSPQYYSLNGLCVEVKTKVGYCDYYSSDGNCLYCGKGYVRTSWGICAADNNPSKNFCRWANFSTCIICNPGYYANTAGECIPANPILGCKIYSTANICSACASGYYMVAGTRACQPIVGSSPLLG